MKKPTFLRIVLILAIVLFALPAYGAWTSAGLQGQEVLTLAEDPGDAATWYAGTAAGDIYKYADGTTGWVLASDGLPVGHAVLGMSIDPSNTDTVYAGLDGAGVYKTTDGGGKLVCLRPRQSSGKGN